MPKYVKTADFLDEEILKPRNSPIKGYMMMEVEKWYGVKVLHQIAILGAETSIGHGDIDIGGTLVRYNNFGCIKAWPGWEDTKWGEWADGTVTVRGVEWLTWPTPQKGMYSWGRYMKVGAGEAYLPILRKPDWHQEFANIYYGSEVPGIEEYVANLKKIEDKYRKLALQFGFRW